MSNCNKKPIAKFELNLVERKLSYSMTLNWYIYRIIFENKVVNLPFTVDLSVE